MRTLSVFALLGLAASFASANTIAFNCIPNNQNAVTSGVLVNAGSTSVTCDGFDAGAGNTITNISYDFLGTFQDAVSTNGNHQLTFTGSSIYGNFGPQDTNIAGAVGSAATSGGSANNTQSVANWVFNVTTANTDSNNVLPNNASYTITGVYTFEANNQGGVPEPSTLALVGGVLILAGIRKFRS